MMEVEFLGTGTSTGVPQIGCGCEVCRSVDPRDKRLRCSAIVSIDGLNILIDCGPDFRQQMLRAQNKHIDAVLITHSHYDHVGGLDDLRPYCYKKPLPLYAQSLVVDDIKTRMPYCFVEHLYPGVPSFQLNRLTEKPFKINDVLIEPLPVMHFKLPIMGYKIGSFVYITDALYVPETTMAKLKDIDTLVINALRIEPHMSHMNLSQALSYIERINPREAYLIHESHGIGLHSVTSSKLPPNVHLAYDTLSISIDCNASNC